MKRKISSEDFNEKYLGKFYGRIEIIDYGEYIKHRLMAITKCHNCNTISTRRIDHLVANNPKYCLNCKEQSYIKVQSTTPQNNHYSAMKHGAKSRGFLWEINKDQFAVITKKNCFYCGEPASNNNYTGYSKVGRKDKISLEYVANGIDRIDSTKGYNKSNIVPCCPICNRIKNHFSIDIFFDKIDKIYNLHLK